MMLTTSLSLLTEMIYDFIAITLNISGFPKHKIWETQMLKVYEDELR